MTIQGNLEVVTYLLENGADLEAIDSSSGSQALHGSVFENQIEIVKYLISKKANINFYNRNGLMPIHLAAGCHNLDLVKVLLENGAQESML